MKKNSVLILDDLADRTPKNKRRTQALQLWAEWIAVRLKAELELLHVIKMPSPFFRDSSEDHKTNLKNELKKNQLLFKTHLRTGNIEEEIIRFEKQTGPYEMLVLGMGGRVYGKTKIFGGVTEEILRHAISPVLVLGPLAQAKKLDLESKDPLRVLVLTDLTQASIEAESYAQELCLRTNTRAVICHSVGSEILKIKKSFYRSRFIPFNLNVIFEKMEKKANARLTSKWKKWHQVDTTVERLLITEQKCLEVSLSKLLDKGFDLVVMGKHSRKFWMEAFLGSNTRAVLSKASTPVLVVRSSEEQRSLDL